MDLMEGMFQDPALMQSQAMVSALRGQPSRVTSTSLSPVSQMRNSTREELEAEHERLSRSPDYSQLEAKSRSNQAASGRSLALAMAAQYAGRGAEPFQAHFLKQSTQQRQPIQVEGGSVEDGQTNIDPGFKNQQRAAAIQRRLSQLDALDARAQSDAEKAAIARERMDTQLELRRMATESSQAIAGMGRAVGQMAQNYNLQQIEDPATGQMFWADPRSGNPVKPVTGPQGQGIIKPEKLPTAATTAIQEQVQTRASIESARAAVEAAPEAFGAVKGGVDFLPGVVGQAGMSARDRQLSDAELTARNQVYNNVSAIIVQRAGLAQTAAEQKRLNSFLPSPVDTSREILIKLRAFEDFTKEQEAATRANATRRPSLPIGPLPTAPTAPTAPVSPAAPAVEDKEAVYQAWKAKRLGATP